MDSDKADYSACVLGLRDYVDKNRFKGVVIGLSGGIDSALCAAMATDALGADRVRCVMLPYRYTSQASRDDAAAIAQALGIRYDIVPIESAVKGFETALAGVFEGTPRDVTEENLQARARGVILMAISNKFGAMVVTTGNKSEMSVGYATLYGDMNGGYNPIKDIYKTEVFRLSRLRNAWKPEGARGPDGDVIPENVITRAPSAELRENQTDQDSLPPYDILDQILERLVEREEPTATIVAAGFDRDTVLKVERMLYLAEYKRRQAAPGRESDLEEFRPRPPLSDRQPLHRSRHHAAAAGPRPDEGRGDAQSRQRGFLARKQSSAAAAALAAAAAATASVPATGRAVRRCAPRACSDRPVVLVVEDAADALGWLMTAAGAAPLPRACGACDSSLAFWSVTTMSPCSSVVESSAPLSASAQLWPARRHEQPDTTSLR